MVKTLAFGVQTMTYPCTLAHCLQCFSKWESGMTSEGTRWTRYQTRGMNPTHQEIQNLRQTQDQGEVSLRTVVRARTHGSPRSGRGGPRLGPEGPTPTKEPPYRQRITQQPKGNWSKQEAVLKATAVRSPLPVMSSILPCPPCLPQVMQTFLPHHPHLLPTEGGSSHRGVQAGGQGTFHPPCHVLHFHMVLAPKGLRTMSTDQHPGVQGE